MQLSTTNGYETCSKMQMLKMQMQSVNTKHMEKDKRHQITAAQKATRTENHSN